MKFQKKKLKNGLTVLHEFRDLPLVSVSITNPFGAAFEKSEEKGIAHFIEHLVFTGTKTRTHEDISREIEKKGGILNAFTAHEVTSFWFKLPSEHIFSGLEILADLLNNPIFEKTKFEKEKRVILEEIKLYKDNPQHAVFEQIVKSLFEKPFGELVIGNKETISSMKRDFVFDYFKKNYSPENFIVTIVGNTDLNKVCEYLEKTFSPENHSPKIQKIKIKNTLTTEERPGIDQANFLFAAHAPLFYSKEYPALEILNAYLAEGMSSKLFLEIREKRGLAYTVKGSLNTEKNYSYYSIYVGTTKEALPEVKNLIIEGFQDISKMTEKELKETKEQLIGSRKVESEESSGVMNALMFHELNGDAEEYYNFEKKISQVSLGQVKSLAENLIKNYSTAAIVPK